MKANTFHHFDYINVDDLRLVSNEFKSLPTNLHSHELLNLASLGKYILSLIDSMHANRWFEDEDSEDENTENLVSIHTVQHLLSPQCKPEYLPMRIENTIRMIEIECENKSIEWLLSNAISAGNEYSVTKKPNTFLIDNTNIEKAVTTGSVSNKLTDRTNALLVTAKVILRLRAALKRGDWDIIRAILKSKPMTTLEAEFEVALKHVYLILLKILYSSSPSFLLTWIITFLLTVELLEDPR